MKGSVKLHRYVTADWHGRFDVYQEVKEFLQPDDIVYFVGDAIDRGPDSLKLAMNIYTDPQFIYLKGNHEDMLVKALTNAQGLRIIDGRYWGQEEALAIWFQNGGRNTFYDLIELPKQEQEEWIKRFSALPTRQLIDDSMIGYPIYLVHSGDLDNELWSRHHFQVPAEQGIIIHGHTPVPLMKDYIPINEAILNDEACWYAGDTKVNIDLGTVWTGRTVLMDLDTFDEHYFDLGEIDNE